MLPDKLAFVDIETTGTSASYGRIIEIGIVRVENDEITDTYTTLINPQTHLPPEIEMLTGITMNDLENQPTFREVAKDILERLVDCVFVAHNVRFDYSFLRQEFLRQNISFSSKHFCTVKLSRALYPTQRHHNLDAIIERFGFNCTQRHRAFQDAKTLWEFYQKARKSFPEDVFLDAINAAQRRPTIPIKLKQEDLDNLPELPGVYIFYGSSPNNQKSKITQKVSTSDHLNIKRSENTGLLSSSNIPNIVPLYIGKSKNIRDRVLSHFSGDIHSTKEMNIAQQVESIETIITAGELGALLLESQLIKKMLPIYNRMLRNKRELVGLIKTTDKNGYDSVKMEIIKGEENQSDKTAKYTTLSFSDSLQPFGYDSFLGFFQSRKQVKEFLANIAKEFNLCEKLLGLEKTSSACFAYRLGRCKGACTKEENPLFYNLRFTTAFYKTKIRPWPFSGPVIIMEHNTITGIKEHFLIDKWCYMGSIKVDNDGNVNSSEIRISEPEMMLQAQYNKFVDPERSRKVSNFGFRASDFSSEYIFDLDMYKILLRFFSKKENLKHVSLLQNIANIFL